MTTPPPRVVERRYRDPIDVIWQACASRCGLSITRSDAAWAAFDGDETLTIATPAALDADDSLAQIVLHELCHALVAGPGATRRRDWGLRGDTDDAELRQEHAAQRLQAALAAPHGLRDFMAVTTDWRGYWDALPDDPLADDAADPAVALAREAWERARSGPWAEALQDALVATARIADAVRDAAEPDSLWATTRARHAVGGLVSAQGVTCGGCAWRVAGDDGVTRCRRWNAVTRDDARGCDRFEPPLSDASCGACGACCREGFHLVPVEDGGALARRYPALIARDDHGAHLPRPDGRCVALTGGGAEGPFRCSVYLLRPAGCRDLAVGGDACLSARRRVGLSR